MIENAKAVIVDSSGNEAAHESYLNVIESVGLTPVFLESAQEALALYGEGDVAVVVSDLRLAEMDGLVLARKIRRLDPDAVVILTAAIERKAELLAALRLGVFDFFVKPFGAREFAAALERAVEQRVRSGWNSEAENVLVSESQGREANGDELKALRLQLEAKDEGIKELEVLLAAKEAEWECALANIEAKSISAEPANLSEEHAEEFELREKALAERESRLDERETFLEHSENTLFDKGQQLQELESELEQRADAVGPADSNSQIDSKNAAHLEAMEAELTKTRRELEERERKIRKTEAIVRAREDYLKEKENILFDREDVSFS